MLDKLEIYPYQRIGENTNRNRSGHIKKKKKPFPQIHINRQVIFNPNVLASLKTLLTVQNVLLAVGAIIISRAFVLGELLPFMFAFVAAFGQNDRPRSFLLAVVSLLGLVTVTTGFSLWTNMVALLIMTGVINYVTVPRDKNWWGIPFLVTSIILIVKSLMLFTDGISLYREMNIVFEAMIAGILTFVFMVGNDVLRKKKALLDFNFEEIASFMIMGIALVMGLNGINIGGLSIASILCRLGVLLAAYLWGSGGGTMVGVMAGIIPSISSSIFAQTLGMYAVSGLLAGIFKIFGRFGVIIGFMLGNLALSMFIAETQATILGIWETGIACIIFFILSDSLKEKIPIQSLGPIKNLKESEIQIMDKKVKEAARVRIQNLAEVFDELSSTLSEPQRINHKITQKTYLNYLYDEISHGFCEKCSRYKRCWDEECYETSQVILDIFTLAETRGEITFEDCPDSFKSRCLYGRELINSVNYLFDNLRVNEYWTQKITESRDLVANQLKGVSQVVKSLADEIDVKTVVDFTLRDKLLKNSNLIAHNIKDITPINTSGEQLYLHVLAGSCADGETCSTAIAPAISSLLGEKMEVCEKKCPRLMGKGNCEFNLTRAFTYKVISGAAQVARESVCGDSFSIATLGGGKELVVLSDGMGVGEKAYTESQAAIRLLENLLNSGFDKETALKTINSVLLLRSNSETFTTIDMLMVDLYTAEVDFIKVGSAPSFVKRGTRVGIVNSNSLPIGILDNLDVVTEKRSLCPRDILVMVSDGVLDANRQISGETWISELLANLHETDPQSIAEKIINKALRMAKNKPRDDMTVICMYIDLNFPH